MSDSTSQSSSARNPLATFPEEIRKAYEHFTATGDPEALDLVILAIVKDYRPDQEATAELKDSDRLIEDLGFDSLALTETVFFIEDLFKVSISNQELLQILTIGDLRTFIRQRLSTAR